MSARAYETASATLTAAYRTHARCEQSPPALDARVLAAAMVQADTARARRQRRQRRQLGWRFAGVCAGLAVLAVLAGVLWRPQAPLGEAMLQPASLDPATEPGAAQSLPSHIELPSAPALPVRSAP